MSIVPKEVVVDAQKIRAAVFTLAVAIGKVIEVQG
jgi:hypothetical protein